MTLQDINFSADTESKLRERAEAAGKDLPTLIREIVEASLEEEADLDPTDLAAIQEGLDQADRGEGYTVEEVREHFRRRGVDIG